MLGNIYAASSISATCPYCNEKVVFTLEHFLNDLQRTSVSATGQCPSCNKNVHFWMLLSDNDEGRMHVDSVYMHPDCKRFYEPASGPDRLPTPVRNTFLSTVDSFNCKHYKATAVCAKATLESIFKYLLEEEQQKLPLADQIEMVKKTQRMTEPLDALSAAIRTGGKLIEHFGMEKELTQSSAKHMVELLDDLISYLYILPQDINELEARLDKCS